MHAWESTRAGDLIVSLTCRNANTFWYFKIFTRLYICLGPDFRQHPPRVRMPCRDHSNPLPDFLSLKSRALVKQMFNISTKFSSCQPLVVGKCNMHAVLNCIPLGLAIKKYHWIWNTSNCVIRLSFRRILKCRSNYSEQLRRCVFDHSHHVNAYVNVRVGVYVYTFPQNSQQTNIAIS